MEARRKYIDDLEQFQWYLTHWEHLDDGDLANAGSLDNLHEQIAATAALAASEDAALLSGAMDGVARTIRKLRSALETASSQSRQIESTVKRLTWAIAIAAVVSAIAMGVVAWSTRQQLRIMHSAPPSTVTAPAPPATP